MDDFRGLLDLKAQSALQFATDSGRFVVCPDLGGRIFAGIAGISPHRIDLDAVTNPSESFNNYGGGNLWPAPEGGEFGFNYQGDEWYVQPAINIQPFSVSNHSASSAVLEKHVSLKNRAGTVVEARMAREVSLSQIPEILQGYDLHTWLAYQSTDSFEVQNEVSVEDALIAAWTLEQFDASNDTIAFCAVSQPREAINFDFYEPPHDRLAYYSKGFAYKVDGQRRGQIGVKKASEPSLIGFYDLSRRLVCIRENVNAGAGTYFNIADNDQPDGPYSAADTYSVFNSDPDMGAFELETIGSARTEGGLLKGSSLVSRTTLAVFEKAADIQEFLRSTIGI